VTATSYVDLAAQTFPECNTAEAYLDGMLVGWGIASAMILIAALKIMRKGT
jgi:hypothetical protein